GTPFYLWNTSKVSDVINKNYPPLTDVEINVNAVRARLHEMEELSNSDSGTDQKLADLFIGTEYDDVPSKIRDEVKRIVERK
ncbi:MAG TPA: hypothetical protein VN455_05755, partial [Methanotrichaceae archaeon]|nr:hypothetical protein [Methanotrichaceae archaeon]